MYRKEIDLIQDFSSQGLVEVPAEIYMFSDLKMLYLDNNVIEELTPDFFWCLRKLVWIDLRSNRIKIIPTSIGQHPNLETVLLQDNLIEMLPLEVGQMPKLKNLQLEGNPLVYPHQSIIRQGTVAIIDFLNGECLRIETSNVCTEQETIDYLTENRRKRLNHVKRSLLSEFCSTPVKKTDNTPVKKTDNTLVKKTDNTPRFTHNKLSKRSRRPKSLHSSSSSSLIGKRDSVEIEEDVLKEIWVRKMLELNTQQYDVLKKENNFDAQRAFRADPKYNGKQTNFTYRPPVPFDQDPDYDKVLTREELRRKKPDTPKKSKGGRASKPPVNVENLIEDIVTSLKEMEVQRRTNRSPRTQMEAAGKEIKKVLGLQRRLSALKIVNSKVN